MKRWAGALGRFAVIPSECVCNGKGSCLFCHSTGKVGRLKGSGAATRIQADDAWGMAFVTEFVILPLHQRHAAEAVGFCD